MRGLGYAVLLAALACGKGKQNPALQQGGLSLSLPSGTQLRAMAGSEADVLLIAVGAVGTVTYSLTGAPGFVSLAGTVLKIAPRI